MSEVESISIGREFTIDRIKKLEVKEFPKITILIPTYNNLPAVFFMSVIDFLSLIKDKIPYKIIITEGIYIWHSRNNLAVKALKSDSEYFIWLDSDVTFSAKALLYLLYEAKDKDMDMVTPVINARREIVAPMVYMRDIDNEIYPVSRIAEDKEWLEIEGSGFGCIVMKRKVLEGMNKKYGRFMFKMIDTTEGESKFKGEDLLFFKEANKLGFRLYCNVFVKFGHYGAIV